MDIHYGSGQHLTALMNDPEDLTHMDVQMACRSLTHVQVHMRPCHISGTAFCPLLGQMPRFTLYIHIAFAFTTVLYAAQTLILARQYVPLAVLWGSRRGGCMGSGSRFDFCAHYRLWLACALRRSFVSSLVFLFVGTERDERERDEGANLYLYSAVM